MARRLRTAIFAHWSPCFEEMVEQVHNSRRKQCWKRKKIWCIYTRFFSFSTHICCW